MLEAAYKVVAIITRGCLPRTMEALDDEPQNRFRAGRSSSKEIFAIKMSLKKRSVHELESL